MVEADSTGAEPTSTNPEEPTDLEKKIIRQVEYYFGDINLGRDKFMQEQIKLDDGWIPMETMLKFNRLAQLSKEPTVITQALSKSTSKLMEISEDSTKIRRSPEKPLPEMNEERRKELMKRTVYCKGFPVEGTTINQLLDFFPKYGEIDNVIMRSFNDKATKTWKFKGSVFVIFPDVEGAQKFLAIESVKYNDVELIRKLQTDYTEEKRKERLTRLKKGKKDKSEKKEGEEKEGEEKEGEEEEEEKEDTEFPRGTVVHLKGLNEKEVMREDLKAAVEKLGIGVAYVDFSKGLDEAWLRLDSKGAAIELASRVKEGKLEIKEDVVAEVRVVDGEEEETFLIKAKDDKRKQMQRSRNKAKRGRGGFGRGKKRKGSPHRGQNKIQKKDE